MAQTTYVENVDRLADVSNDFCGSAIDRWQFRFEKANGAKRNLENETWAANATHVFNSKSYWRKTQFRKRNMGRECDP